MTKTIPDELMQEDVNNLMILQAFYDTVTYDKDALPSPDETEYYQLQGVLTLQLSTGNYVRYSLYYKDYSILKISIVTEPGTDSLATTDQWKSIYAQKITKTEYYYLREDHIYPSTRHLSDVYDPEEDLIAVCLFFENGRKLSIFSGEMGEGRSANEVKVLSPDTLLLIIFDSKKYSYLNMPEHWK